MSDEKVVSKFKWYQDSNGNTSSKRIFGAITMAVFLISAVGLNIGSVLTGNDVGSNAAGLMSSVGYVGAALLGIGVAEGFVKK